MRSMGAIPVHRGTARIGTTFKESVAALQAGDSILIFPDVDYTDGSEGIGEIYDGFLLLERFWRKASARPLRFVPLRLDADCRGRGCVLRPDRAVEVGDGPGAGSAAAGDQRPNCIRKRSGGRHLRRPPGLFPLFSKKFTITTFQMEKNILE